MPDQVLDMERGANGANSAESADVTDRMITLNSSELEQMIDAAVKKTLNSLTNTDDQPLTARRYFLDILYRLSFYISCVIDAEELEDPAFVKCLQPNSNYRGLCCETLYQFSSMIFKGGIIIAFIFLIKDVFTFHRDQDGAYKLDSGSTESLFDINGAAIDLSSLKVYDAPDLVTYYDDSAFIMTSFRRIPQVRGICDDEITKCNFSLPCPSLKLNPTGDGYFTGSCNYTTGMCLKRAWCPLNASKDAYPKTHLSNIGNLTVKIALSTRFPSFDTTVDDKIALTVEDIANATNYNNNKTTNNTAMIEKRQTNSSVIDPIGVFTIALNTEWYCYRTVSGKDNICNIIHNFTELDNADITSAESKVNSLSHQDKVVTPNYYQGPKGIMMRNLTVANGILLTTIVDSYLYQFQFVNMVQAIGSVLVYPELLTRLAVLIAAYLCCFRRSEKMKDLGTLCNGKNDGPSDSVIPITHLNRNIYDRI